LAIKRDDIERDSRRWLALKADQLSSAIPFAQRLTCTIAEACQATGLGRTKIYELIGKGQIETTRIGRRRLVLVHSLVMLIDTKT
jgi:excisionase family DNA binding protein